MDRKKGKIPSDPRPVRDGRLTRREKVRKAVESKQLKTGKKITFKKRQDTLKATEQNAACSPPAVKETSSNQKEAAAATELRRLATTQGFWTEHHSRGTLSYNRSKVARKILNRQLRRKKGVKVKTKNHNIKTTSSMSTSKGEKKSPKEVSESNKSIKAISSLLSKIPQPLSELKRLQTTEGFWSPSFTSLVSPSSAETGKNSSNDPPNKSPLCTQEVKRLQRTKGFFPNVASTSSTRHSSRDGSPASSTSSLDRSARRGLGKSDKGMVFSDDVRLTPSTTPVGTGDLAVGGGRKSRAQLPAVRVIKKSKSSKLESQSDDGENRSSRVKGRKFIKRNIRSSPVSLLTDKTPLLSQRKEKETENLSQKDSEISPGRREQPRRSQKKDKEDLPKSKEKVQHQNDLKKEQGNQKKNNEQLNISLGEEENDDCSSEEEMHYELVESDKNITSQSDMEVNVPMPPVLKRKKIRKRDPLRTTRQSFSTRRGKKSATSLHLYSLHMLKRKRGNPRAESDLPKAKRLKRSSPQARSKEENNKSPNVPLKGVSSTKLVSTRKSSKLDNHNVKPDTTSQEKRTNTKEKTVLNVKNNSLPRIVRNLLGEVKDVKVTGQTPVSKAKPELDLSDLLKSNELKRLETTQGFWSPIEIGAILSPHRLRQNLRQKSPPKSPTRQKSSLLQHRQKMLKSLKKAAKMKKGKADGVKSESPTTLCPSEVVAKPKKLDFMGQQHPSKTLRPKRTKDDVSEMKKAKSEPESKSWRRGRRKFIDQIQQHVLVKADVKNRKKLASKTKAADVPLSVSVATKLCISNTDKEVKRISPSTSNPFGNIFDIMANSPELSEHMSGTMKIDNSLSNSSRDHEENPIITGFEKIVEIMSEEKDEEMSDVKTVEPKEEEIAAETTLEKCDEAKFVKSEKFYSNGDKHSASEKSFSSPKSGTISMLPFDATLLDLHRLENSKVEPANNSNTKSGNDFLPKSIDRADCEAGVEDKDTLETVGDIDKDCNSDNQANSLPSTVSENLEKGVCEETLVDGDSDMSEEPSTKSTLDDNSLEKTESLFNVEENPGCLCEIDTTCAAEEDESKLEDDAQCKSESPDATEAMKSDDVNKVSSTIEPIPIVGQIVMDPDVNTSPDMDPDVNTSPEGVESVSRSEQNIREEGNQEKVDFISSTVIDNDSASELISSDTLQSIDKANSPDQDLHVIAAEKTDTVDNSDVVDDQLVKQILEDKRETNTDHHAESVHPEIVPTNVDVEVNTTETAEFADTADCVKESTTVSNMDTELCSSSETSTDQLTCAVDSLNITKSGDSEVTEKPILTQEASPKSGCDDNIEMVKEKVHSDLKEKTEMISDCCLDDSDKIQNNSSVVVLATQAESPEVTPVLHSKVPDEQAENVKSYSMRERSTEKTIEETKTEAKNYRGNVKVSSKSPARSPKGVLRRVKKRKQNKWKRGVWGPVGAAKYKKNIRQTTGAEHLVLPAANTNTSHVGLLNETDLVEDASNKHDNESMGSSSQVSYFSDGKGQVFLPSEKSSTNSEPPNQSVNLRGFSRSPKVVMQRRKRKYNKWKKGVWGGTSKYKKNIKQTTGAENIALPAAKSNTGQGGHLGEPGSVEDMTEKGDIESFDSTSKVSDFSDEKGGADSEIDPTEQMVTDLAKKMRSRKSNQMLLRLATEAIFGNAPIVDEEALLTRTQSRVLPMNQMALPRQEPGSFSGRGRGRRTDESGNVVYSRGRITGRGRGIAGRGRGIAGKGRGVAGRGRGFTGTGKKRGRPPGKRRQNSEPSADLANGELFIRIPETSIQCPTSLPLPVLKPLELITPLDHDSSLDAPPVLTPQFAMSFEEYTKTMLDDGMDNDVVEEFVDDMNLQLYWSDDEKSPVKKSSPIKENTPIVNKPMVPDELKTAPQPDVVNNPPKKLKGKRGKPPGIKVANKSPNKTPVKSLYQPKITELVRTFEFRKKTTRSPLEMLEMKRRQEEAIYDLQEHQRRARLIQLREKRNARLSPEDAIASSSDEEESLQTFDIKPCFVVLNDFVKKLKLDGMFVPGFEENEDNSSPFSLEYEDDEKDEDWYADLEDIEEEDEELAKSKESSSKRPYIPRLKIKRVMKKQKVKKSKPRNLVAQMKSPEQEPLKLVIKTEPEEQIKNQVDLSVGENSGFVGSYLDFLKERPSEGTVASLKSRKIKLPKPSSPAKQQLSTEVNSSCQAIGLSISSSAQSGSNLENESIKEHIETETEVSLKSDDVDINHEQPLLIGESIPTSPSNSKDGEMLILDLSNASLRENKSEIPAETVIVAIPVAKETDFSNQTSLIDDPVTSNIISHYVNEDAKILCSQSENGKPQIPDCIESEKETDDSAIVHNAESNSNVGLSSEQNVSNDIVNKASDEKVAGSDNQLFVISEQEENVMDKNTDEVIDKDEDIVVDKNQCISVAEGDNVTEKMKDIVVEKNGSIVTDTNEDMADESREIVPEKNVDIVPENIVDIVPEKIVDVVPEKIVDSVPEKNVDSVPEKNVDSVPENIVDSVPEKILDSVPEKNVDSVLEKNVDSVPEKTVDIVTERNENIVPERNAHVVAEEKADIITEKDTVTVTEKNVHVVAENNTDIVKEKNADAVTENSADSEKNADVITERATYTESNVDIVTDKDEEFDLKISKKRNDHCASQGGESEAFDSTGPSSDLEKVANQPDDLSQSTKTNEEVDQNSLAEPCVALPPTYQGDTSGVGRPETKDTHSNNNNEDKPCPLPSQDRDLISSPVHSTSEESLVEKNSKVKTILQQDRLPSSSRYTCKRCDFFTSTKLTIECHIYSHIPGVQFQCVRCQSEFSSMAAAASHLKNTHSSTDHKLHITGYVDESSFYDRTEVPGTLLEQDNNPRYVAPQLSTGSGGQSPPFIISVVVSGGNSNRTGRPAGPTRRFVCTHCGFSTNVKKDVKQHVSDLHPSQGLYACSLCNESVYPSEEDMKQHSMSVHPSRPKPYKKLPDFYDADHLAKMEHESSQEELGSNVYRVNSVVNVNDADSSSVDHRLKAKEYLDLQEDWKGKKSAEADSTTAVDYSEDNSGGNPPLPDAGENDVTDTCDPDDSSVESSAIAFDPPSPSRDEKDTQEDQPLPSSYTSEELMEVDDVVTPHGDESSEVVDDEPLGMKIVDVVSLSGQHSAFQDDENDLQSQELLSEASYCEDKMEELCDPALLTTDSTGTTLESSVSLSDTTQVSQATTKIHEERLVEQSSLHVAAVEKSASSSSSSPPQTSSTPLQSSSSIENCQSAEQLSQSPVPSTSEVPSTEALQSSQKEPEVLAPAALSVNTDISVPSSPQPQSSSSSSSEISSTPAPTSSTEEASSSSSVPSSLSSSFMGGLPLSYKCKACKVHTPYLLMMVKHLKSRHPTIRCFSCPYCNSNSSFVSQKQLRHHIRAHHPAMVDKNEVSLSKEAKKLVEAMVLPYNPQCTRVGNRLVLEEDIHTCTVCAIRLTSLSSVYDHLNEKHSDLFEFVCPVCQAYKNKSLHNISLHCTSQHGSKLDKDKVHVSVPKYLFSILTCISSNGKYTEKALVSEASNSSNSSSATTTKSSTTSSPSPVSASATITASVDSSLSSVDARTVNTDSTHKSTTPVASNPQINNATTNQLINSLTPQQQVSLSLALPTGSVMSPLVAIPVAAIPTSINQRPIINISSALFDTSSLISAAASLSTAIPIITTANPQENNFQSSSVKTSRPSSKSPRTASLPVLNVPSVKARNSSSPYPLHPSHQPSPGPASNITPTDHNVQQPTALSAPASSYIEQFPEDEPNPDAFKIFNLRPTGLTPTPVMQTAAPTVSPGIPTVFPPVSASSLSLGFIPGAMAGFPAGMVIPQNLVHNAFPFALRPGNPSAGHPTTNTALTSAKGKNVIFRPTISNPGQQIPPGFLRPGTAPLPTSSPHQTHQERHLLQVSSPQLPIQNVQLAHKHHRAASSNLNFMSYQVSGAKPPPPNVLPLKHLQHHHPNQRPIEWNFQKQQQFQIRQAMSAANIPLGQSISTPIFFSQPSALPQQQLQASSSPSPLISPAPSQSQSAKKGKRGSQMYQCPYCTHFVELRALEVASHIQQIHPGRPVTFRKVL